MNDIFSYRMVNYNLRSRSYFAIKKLSSVLHELFSCGMKVPGDMQLLNKTNEFKLKIRKRSHIAYHCQLYTAYDKLIDFRSYPFKALCSTFVLFCWCQRLSLIRMELLAQSFSGKGSFFKISYYSRLVIAVFRNRSD